MKAKTSGFAICVIVLALFSVAAAQQAQPKIRRIGILRPGAPPDPFLEIFIEKLRDLHYINKKNIHTEVRFAAANAHRLPDLATELVGQNPDVIWGQSSPVIFALKQATKIIPIVFTGTSDPVATGMVSSLARPGGNVTGVTLMASDLWPKRLELLKEIAPKLSTVAMVWNKGHAGMNLEAKATEEIARPLGVQLQDRGIKDPNELEMIFGTISKDRPDGFLALMDPVLNANRKRILDFLVKNRLPAIFETKEWVEGGGLISYGPDFPDAVRRAATITDKILKGAWPADIPVEQPTKFELVINLKAAKQIGLTIPPDVLARADRVIK